MDFDYIVVGAGSAGCVLANRLSADPSHSVLLLEAGGSDRHMNVSIPAAFSNLFTTERDWHYYTQPEHCLADRQVYIPRGKMLGGSSSMNAMIYIRGHRADYDGWAAAGCDGWSYDDVLPYFKKAEHNERGADRFHGVGGPLNVADPRDVNVLSSLFVDACEDIGIERNSDFNGADQRGAGVYQVTQRSGARWSTARGYLRPVANRPNLTVESGAMATEILFVNDAATGVAFRQDGRQREAWARREIIIATGAINTPQLLMLSGIGPADHLAEMGIDVLVDNPNVGAHLQDHPVIAAWYHVTQPVTLAVAEEAARLVEYATRRTGLLTSNVGEAGAFVESGPGVEAPDIQFHFAPGFFIRHGFETIPGHGMTIAPTLVSVKSRGRITLRSADPKIHPDIRTNALEHPDDVTALLAGFRMARRIGESQVFDAYRGDEALPGPDVGSDAEVVDFMRRRAELLYHPSCTARMGADASSAVVDSQLRVFGIDGLRVADASIMPSVVRGNTNAPTIMIAEKAAEMVLASA